MAQSTRGVRSRERSKRSKRPRDIKRSEGIRKIKKIERGGGDQKRKRREEVPFHVPIMFYEYVLFNTLFNIIK